MRILTRADVEHAISMDAAISAVRCAFAELSTGQAIVPQRLVVPLEKNNGANLFMPGYLPTTDALAVKIVSVRDNNPKKHLPYIHALVLLIDTETGRILSAMEGACLTSLRTGAASGVATDLLARRDAEVAAIFGAGVQGRTQLMALCSVRKITLAWIYDAEPQFVRSYIDEIQPRLGSAVELLSASSTREAVCNADVICTATTSRTPVFDGADLKAGVHINGIGSYTPEMQEIDFTTLRRASKIVVDSRECAMVEAGELISGINQRVISSTAIYGEIGEIVAGLKVGRENDEEITFFKSVGNAVQDVAVAHAIYLQAMQSNLGVEVDL
jgi:alanine dehydrogenase